MQKRTKQQRGRENRKTEQKAIGIDYRRPRLAAWFFAFGRMVGLGLITTRTLRKRKEEEKGTKGIHNKCEQHHEASATCNIAAMQKPQDVHNNVRTGNRVRETKTRDMATMSTT